MQNEASILGSCMENHKTQCKKVQFFCARGAETGNTEAMPVYLIPFVLDGAA
jgi:hypothetical protein